MEKLEEFAILFNDKYLAINPLFYSTDTLYKSLEVSKFSIHPLFYSMDTHTLCKPTVINTNQNCSSMPNTVYAHVKPACTHM